MAAVDAIIAPMMYALLRGIQHLLYDEGYTIKGVKKILKEHGNKYAIAAGNGESLEGFASSPVHQDTDASISDGVAAVSVSQVMGKQSAAKKGKGLLKRLVGKDAKIEQIVEALDISGDDRQLLQTALYELLECKRLLDQTR